MSKRVMNEVVELTQDCELGKQGERAVVVDLKDKYMTLLFPNRELKFKRVECAGADYRFLRGA